MTFREVGAAEILGLLGDGGNDEVLRACIAALRLYAHDSYTIGGTPANIMREGLEVKFRHAASKGKTFIGESELLLRLYDLGSNPVAVVSADHGIKHFYVYVNPETVKSIGAIIMYDQGR